MHHDAHSARLALASCMLFLLLMCHSAKAMPPLNQRCRAWCMHTLEHLSTQSRLQSPDSNLQVQQNETYMIHLCLHIFCIFNYRQGLDGGAPGGFDKLCPLPLKQRLSLFQRLWRLLDKDKPVCTALGWGLWGATGGREAGLGCEDACTSAGARGLGQAHEWQKLHSDEPHIQHVGLLGVILGDLGPCLGASLGTLVACWLVLGTLEPLWSSWAALEIFLESPEGSC